MAELPASTNTPIEKLALADEVFFCVTEGQGIFLDLKRDDYSAISLAIGAASRDAPDLKAAIVEAFKTHRQDLLDAHLVEDEGDASEGVLAFQSLVRPRSNIFHPDDQRAFGIQRELRTDVRIGVGDVLDFFLASHRASRLLMRATDGFKTTIPSTS